MSIEQLVGREPEMALLNDALGRAHIGPVVVYVEGEAGIGKTSVLHACARTASDREFLVLRAAAGDMERDLAYAVLGDLLESAADALVDLPGPQRDALEAMLVRRMPEQPVEPRTMAVTLLNALRMLAAERPLALVIDDLQWIDISSMVALRFAIRRLRHEHVLLLASVRTESALSDAVTDAVAAGPAPDDLLVDRERTEFVRLGPIDLASLDALLRRRGIGPMAPPRLADLHRLSVGNPLLAFELAKAGDVAADLSTPGPPPARIERILARRLRSLDAEIRPLLSAAAAMRRATTGALARLAGPGPVAVLIDEATRANLLNPRAGQIEFSHPLVRSAILALLPSGELAAMHRQVAGVVEDVEERAYHLALGTERADDVVAAELEQASRRVARRGAPAEASLLAEHAARLTPHHGSPVWVERLLLAAEHSSAAGESARTLRLILRAREAANGGDPGARVLMALAEHESQTVSIEAGIRRYQEALGTAASDGLKATIRTEMAESGRLVVPQKLARAWAAEAVALAERSDEAQVASRALAVSGLIEFNATGRVPTDVMRRALELAESDIPIHRSARAVLGHQLMWSGQLDAARREFEALLEAGERAGSVQLGTALWYLALVEWLAGNWDRAQELILREQRLNEQSGWESDEAGSLWVLALLEVCRGDLIRGRRDAERGLALARSTMQRPFIEACHWVLCLADQLEGRPNQVPGEWLELIDARGQRLPGDVLLHPDLVEALVRSGRLGEAEQRLESLERDVVAVDHPFGVPGAARARAVLLAARNDLHGALDSLDTSRSRETLAGFPLIGGRTHLLKGQLLRRTRRRSAAREALDHAAAIFATLGAAPWLALTHHELQKLGRRTLGPRQLSEAEERVARLAAAGNTNGEIATALFLSPKTVEWTLTNVYGKLGLRSRVDLARLFSGNKGSAVSPESVGVVNSATGQEGD